MMKNTEMPEFSLAKILWTMTVVRLRKRARLIFKIEGTSKMNKAALIDAITAAILSPKRFETLLYFIDDDVWQLFQKAAETGTPQSTKKCSEEDCLLLIALCYFGTLDDCDTVYVPDEIRTVYFKLKDTGFLTRRAHSVLLHRYAQAAVNLYGVIRQDDFIALFNSQSGETTTPEELFEVLIRFIMIDSDYCFWDAYIVSDEFEEDDFEGVRFLLEQVGEKPRYVPPKQTFLKYANWDYIEPNRYAAELEKYLIHDLGVRSDQARTLVTELQYSCSGEASMQQKIDVFHECGVELDGDSLERVVPLIVNISNSTRLWSNNGHTPQELFRYYEKMQYSKLPAGAGKKKIGRNDPCPCGSGKKYKKCCGG